ncbi:MAG: hypothetical protein WCI18_05730 [Pseudomonadota bacterium]
MKNIGLVLVIAGVAACSIQPQSSSGVLRESTSSTKTISGEDAKAFMEALSDSGVQDNNQAVGVWNLKAARVDCSAPVVVLNPIANCIIKTDDFSLAATEVAAKTLYEILIKNVAAAVGGPVGVSQATVTDVACSSPVILYPNATCSFKVSRSTVNAASKPIDNQLIQEDASGIRSSTSASKKTISGDDAKALMEALNDSGVKDNTQAVGVWNLKAVSIDCSAPVVLNPIADCTIKTDDSLLVATEAAAKTLYDLLIKNGAAAVGGPVGVSHAVVSDIACSSPVVPNPISSCSFQVKD